MPDPSRRRSADSHSSKAQRRASRGKSAEKNPLKMFGLHAWGGLFLLGGLVSFAIGPKARNQAEQLGKAAGAGLLILIGIALIVTHFVRARK